MITFKQYLEEAPRKKKSTEDDWVGDYESGYERLRSMQQHYNVKIAGTRREFQLFVPKRRDPKLELERQRDRRWREAKRENPDAELKEEKAPVLTGFSESPPGDNKPSGAFWTSTAIQKKDGTWTSDWYQFVQRTFREWQTDYGYLFEVQGNPLVFDLSYAEEYYTWAVDKDRMKKPEREYFRKYSTEDARYRFPWDELVKHFDAAHHDGFGRGSYHGSEFTQGWDVESTAWFKTSSLKYRGAVKLWDGYDDE